ncbi:DUF4857 domain-containing protein [Saccharicrinis sp. FJH54]|uniref:DUF4857 domain-containing protein n=1 Tax=Saccharicrinis sp. FJH54 TaxID=3344665 RepID=UPI0035D43493
MIRLSKNIVIIISILTLMFLIPLLFDLIFKPLPENVLITYSTYKDEFLLNKKHGPTTQYSTADGQQISKETYYSRLPVFYYRKLEKNGKLPDSIKGEPLIINNLKQHSYFFRLPEGIADEVQPVLVPMFENTDEATHYNIPVDFFSFKHSIKFINVYTGEEDTEKSEKFTNSLVEPGFVFPVKRIYGDIRVQKNFDNGYYFLDAHNHLFNLKMVRGEAVTEIIPLPRDLTVKFIFCTDPVNMEILAVIVSQQNEIYLHLGTTNAVIKTDINGYNPSRDELLIFGNQFNKTFLFQNDREVRLNVINDNYKTFRSFQYKRSPKKFQTYDVFKDFFIPVRITFNFRKNQVIKPHFEISAGLTFLLFNLTLALTLFLIRKKEKPYKALLITLVAGLPAFITFLVIREN